MRQTRLSLLLLTLSASHAFAEPTSEPAVHAASARLSEAQAAVYKKRALHLVVDSTVLLASSPRRPRAIQGDGWRIQHASGAVLRAEDVANELHRGHEVEGFEHSVGSGAFYTGLVMLGAAVVPGIVAGVGAATADRGDRDAFMSMGGISGATAGVGLITMLIGHLAQVSSERQVPIDVATQIVHDYNAGLVDRISGVQVAATATATAALALAAPVPASPSAPSVPALPEKPTTAPAPSTASARLGLELLESEGVRVVSVRRTDKRIEPGDVLVAIDEIPAASVKVIGKVLARVPPGDQLTVRVRRQGREIDVAIRI